MLKQVTIKEEVDLSIEDIGDTTYSLPSMPFYGKVKVERVCSFQWWYTIAAVKVTVGNQSQSTPCYNCGTSGCAPCITGSYIFLFDNIPQGSSVSIEEQICPNGIPTSIPLMFIQQTSNQYSYKGYHQGHWWSLGAVTFTTQTPPGCNPSFDCIEENFLPDIIMNEVQNGYADYNACESEENPIGVTLPIWGDPEYNFEISSCYNKQLQRWWFNLNNDHSFFINYIYDICEENIPPEKEMIYDWQNFPTNYGCENIINDLYNHFAYGFGYAHFWLQYIVEVHEQAHLNDILYFINSSKEDFYNKLLSHQKNCNDFSSITQANNYWREILELEFANYKTNVSTKYSDYKKSFGITFENAVHEKLTVKGAIYNQINLVQIFYGCN